MAEQLYFARHTKLFIEQLKTGGTAGVAADYNIWEVPVMDGFSFSQATNASEVTLAEMESTKGISRRGKMTFNDSYAPAEWSFQTYVRPFASVLDATGGWESGISDAFHHSVEEALWANFVAVNSWQPTPAAGSIVTLNSPPTSAAIDRDPGTYVIETTDYTTSGSGTRAVFEVTFSDATDAAATIVLKASGTGFIATEIVTVPASIVGGTGDFTFTVATVDDKSTWDKGVVSTTTGTTYNFASSNRSIIGEFNLLFEIGSCSGDDPVIFRIENAVANSVSIDFDIDGIAMLSWSGFGNIIEDVTGTDTNYPATGGVTPTIREGIDSTSNFIRNRLTTLGITAADVVTFPGDNNNGVYNVVLTGGSISFENNITYLTPDTLCKVDQPIGHVTGNRNISGNFTCYVNTDSGSSHDLWEDLIGATDTVTNSFALIFSIGGSLTPTMIVDMPTASLEIPAHSIEDVIALDVNFSALPSDITQTDEATIQYVGS